MRSTKSSAPAPMTQSMSRSHSIHVRPIENGFIKSVSRDTDAGYEHRETFHRKMPSMGMGGGTTKCDETGSCGLAGAKAELCK